MFCGVFKIKTIISSKSYIPRLFRDQETLSQLWVEYWLRAQFMLISWKCNLNSTPVFVAQRTSENSIEWNVSVDFRLISGSALEAPVVMCWELKQPLTLGRESILSPRMNRSDVSARVRHGPAAPRMVLVIRAAARPGVERWQWTSECDLSSFEHLPIGTVGWKRLDV